MMVTLMTVILVMMIVVAAMEVTHEEPIKNTT